MGVPERSKGAHVKAPVWLLAQEAPTRTSGAVTRVSGDQNLRFLEPNGSNGVVVTTKEGVVHRLQIL